MDNNNNNNNNKAKSLLINIIINVVISQIVFWVAFFINASRKNATVDAFFVTGFSFLLFALLRVVTSEGVFYSVAWGTKKFFDLFRKTPKHNYKYFEYVESRQNEPKGTIWPTALVGLIYFIVSLIIFRIMM